jgi:hypothetical protein
MDCSTTPSTPQKKVHDGGRYSRESRLLIQNRKSLVLQGRRYFRNLHSFTAPG